MTCKQVVDAQTGSSEGSRLASVHAPTRRQAERSLLLSRRGATSFAASYGSGSGNEGKRGGTVKKLRPPQCHLPPRVQVTTPSRKRVGEASERKNGDRRAARVRDEVSAEASVHRSKLRSSGSIAGPAGPAGLAGLAAGRGSLRVRGGQAGCPGTPLHCGW